MDVSDHVIAGPHGALPLRIYRPGEATGHGLVWVHGGGFAGGDLDMPEADWVSRAFAERGIAVVSVDYRLSPLQGEWVDRLSGSPRDGVRYPVAHDEVVAAFRWAVASDVAGGPWAIGGASAGANLATGAVLRLLDEGDVLPALVVLAYPTLQAAQEAPDSALRALLDADPDADRFSPATVRGMYENYLGGPVEDAPVYAVPGTASAAHLARFPATIMVNSETDELRVSGEAFARALAAAGREIDASTEPGTTHGHLNRPEEPAATASVDRFAARILAVSPHPKEQP